MISTRLSFIFSTAVLLATLTTTIAAPAKPAFHGGHSINDLLRRQGLSSAEVKKNGETAQRLNRIFAAGVFKEGEDCEEGTSVCIGTSVAECSEGKWAISVSCPDVHPGTTCYATPLFQESGASTACDTRGNTIARIERTGATGGVRGEDAVEDESCEEGEEDCICTEVDNEESAPSASSSAPAPAAATPTGSNYRRARSFGRRQALETFPVSEVPLTAVTELAGSASSTTAPSTTVTFAEPLATEDAGSSISESAPASSASATDGNTESTEPSASIESVEPTGPVETVTVVSTVTIFTVPAPAPTAVESKSDDAPASSAEASSSIPEASPSSIPEADESISVELPGRTGLPEDAEPAPTADSSDSPSSASASEVATESPAPTESAAPSESADAESSSVSASSSSEVAAGGITFIFDDALASAAPRA